MPTFAGKTEMLPNIICVNHLKKFFSTSSPTVQCYHGPDFFKKWDPFFKKTGPKSDLFLEEGHFIRKTDLKGTVFMKKRELLQEKGT